MRPSCALRRFVFGGRKRRRREEQFAAQARKRLVRVLDDSRRRAERAWAFRMSTFLRIVASRHGALRSAACSGLASACQRAAAGKLDLISRGEQCPDICKKRNHREGWGKVLLCCAALDGWPRRFAGTARSAELVFFASLNVNADAGSRQMRAAGHAKAFSDLRISHAGARRFARFRAPAERGAEIRRRSGARRLLSQRAEGRASVARSARLSLRQTASQDRLRIARPEKEDRERLQPLVNECRFRGGMREAERRAERFAPSAALRIDPSLSGRHGSRPD